MKFGGVTVCFNEANMVKYVMPYWERAGIDKLIVYDNMSTDNSVELLKQYPFVEVRPYDTGGKFNDRMNSLTKDAACKELREQGYDWIYSGDFDEVVYCFNPDFKAELAKIEKLGGNVYCRDLVHPFTLDSNFVYDDSKLIHEQLPHFLTWKDYTNWWFGSKVLMHNINGISRIKYSDGQHEASFGPDSKPVYFGYPFISFHLKYVDWPVLERNSQAKHDRIKWRTEGAKEKDKHARYINNLYQKSIDNDAITKLKDKLYRQTVKANTLTWESFMERYNTFDFIVNRSKNKKDARIIRLDYDNIDKSIFYQ